jgi:spore coat protein A, manganese oxidase
MSKISRRLLTSAKITRRDLVQTTALVSLGLMAPRAFKRRAYAQVPGGMLDPTSIRKYAAPLIIPPQMPKTDTIGQIDYYEIAVRQFQQQILPTGMPTTAVWSYGSVNHPGTFNYPAFTIEAKFRRPVRVKWINDLVDAKGNFLPHLLPVDPTLHWANPPGGVAGRDMRPTFDETPDPYVGPIPIVTHLHGGHSNQESDGNAEAWYLPDADDLPAGFATEGTFYTFFANNFFNKFRVEWGPGTATFQYDNDQRATTLWYHDHTLGMTRLNLYAGPAGFYLLRGGRGDLPVGPLPGPAPGVGDHPLGRYYEIPLAIQDRSFNKDGSLFYPDSREFFDGFGGPYVPGSDVPPIWNPEFFGNTMVVNGRTWPFLEVEPRRYRFRFLNGCNSRFLILKFDDPSLTFWQIGADGGFLPAPVQLDHLLMGPAERADVIVDFTDIPVGTSIKLLNLGPDEPFGGGIPAVDFDPADPDTTGQVMEFQLVPLASTDNSEDPATLTLPHLPSMRRATNRRHVSLNEEMSTLADFEGPIAALLGVLDGAGDPVPLRWEDSISENPALDAVEIWEIYNFTEDAHPIHIHDVQFKVVNRETFDGEVRPPEVWETGDKNTVIAYPQEITRVKALFDQPGLFVWHCHILEHEDNQMMRPYHIGPIPDDLPIA